MKKTIGWAAVGQDGEIVAGNSPLTFDHFFIYRTSSPGLVRVEIRECREKERMTGKAGKKRSGKK